MEVDVLGKLTLFGLMISAVSGQRKATPAAGFGIMEMGCRRLEVVPKSQYNGQEEGWSREGHPLRA